MLYLKNKVNLHSGCSAEPFRKCLARTQSKHRICHMCQGSCGQKVWRRCQPLKKGLGVVCGFAFSCRTRMSLEWISQTQNGKLIGGEKARLKEKERWGEKSTHRSKPSASTALLCLAALIPTLGKIHALKTLLNPRFRPSSPAFAVRSAETQDVCLRLVTASIAPLAFLQNFSPSLFGFLRMNDERHEPKSTTHPSIVLLSKKLSTNSCWIWRRWQPEHRLVVMGTGSSSSSCPWVLVMFFSQSWKNPKSRFFACRFGSRDRDKNPYEKKSVPPSKRPTSFELVAQHPHVVLSILILYHGERFLKVWGFFVLICRRFVVPFWTLFFFCILSLWSRTKPCSSVGS